MTQPEVYTSDREFGRAELIERYAAEGWKLLQLHPETKRPVGNEWQRRDGLTPKAATAVASRGLPIGVQAGEVSGWLSCVDLDCPEAVRLAPRFLLDTLKAGKGGIPSHYVYYSEGLDYAQFGKLDEPGELIAVKAAANGQGHQFVVAPSVHPEKGPYEWIGGFDPERIARVDPGALLESVRHLAVAALIAAKLPEKGRHRYSLALAGYLLRNGLELPVAVKILQSVWECAGAPREGAEAAKRNTLDTAARLERGEAVVGGRTLEELAPGMPHKLAKFLGWRGETYDEAERPKPPTAPHSFRLTDLGNAERLVGRHGQDLRYCHLWGKWLVWDGRRWEVDAAGEVSRRAADTVRSIYADAARAADADERKRIARHAEASESRARVEAMIALARSLPSVPAKPEHLDADPWLLNVENGTIDLRTGVLREHSREDLITKLAPVRYDPNAEAPRFGRFLREVLAGDEDLIGFVRRFAGYSLTGSTRERVFAILWGRGKNGKSTLVELLRDVLGDYATNTDVETILTRKYSGVGNDVAALKGARFVSAAEVEQGRALAESKVKNLTGRDTVTARFLFAEPFDFRPEFKLWLSTNNKPIIRGTDDAIWDRIRLVRFTQRFTGEQADTGLPEKLRDELPGVLRWLIEGCLEWQREGLDEPDEVRNATEGYRAEMDTLAAFIEDRCVTGAGMWVEFKRLFGEWEGWCKANLEDPGNSRRFADALTQRGYEKDNGAKNIAIRRGIALKHDGGDDPNPSRVNDPEPDPDSEPPADPPNRAEDVNRVNERAENVNPQNTCKTDDSGDGVNEGYQKSKPFEETPSRRGEVGNSLTSLTSLTQEGGDKRNRDIAGRARTVVERPDEYWQGRLEAFAKYPEGLLIIEADRLAKELRPGEATNEDRRAVQKVLREWLERGRGRASG